MDKNFVRASVGRVVIIVAFLVQNLLATAYAAVTVTTLAVAGQTAPGTGGATFVVDGFDEEMANANGDVAFFSFLSGSGFGVFLYRNATAALELVALQGQNVSGVGTLNGGFDGPAISGDGSVFFVDRNISGLTTAALLEKASIGNRPPFSLIKAGDRAPGTNNGVFLSFEDIGVNKGGAVAVIADYTEDGGTTIKTGVFMVVRPYTIVPIVLSGDVLPGTGGGVVPTPNSTFSGTIDGPWLNGNGTVLFQVDNISGGSGGFSGSVFAKRANHPIESVILIGDTVPGGTVQEVKLARPALNNFDVVAAGLLLQNDASGDAKFLATKPLGGSLTFCLDNRTAQPAPGTTGTFGDLGAPAINDAERLAFSAVVNGDANNTAGIFTCQNGTLDKVVVPSDTKPIGTWGSTIEEVSQGGNFVVFLDENGSPTGAFRALKTP